MPRLLSDSESDVEYPVSTSNIGTAWNNQSPRNSSSLSSLYAPDNLFTPFQSPMNSNFIQTKPKLVSPVSLNKTCNSFASKGLNDPNQCMFFVMPIHNDIISNNLQSYPAEMNPKEKLDQIQPPLPVISKTKNSLKKCLQLTSNDKQVLKMEKEESDDFADISDIEVTVGRKKMKKRMKKVEQVRKSFIKLEKMPIIKLTRIDEVYNIPSRSISLKKIKPLLANKMNAKCSFIAKPKNKNSEISTVKQSKSFLKKETLPASVNSNVKSPLKTRSGKVLVRNPVYMNKVDKVVTKSKTSSQKHNNLPHVRRSTRKSLKSSISSVKMRPRSQRLLQKNQKRLKKKDNRKADRSRENVSFDNSKLIISVVKVLNSSSESKGLKDEKKNEPKITKQEIKEEFDNSKEENLFNQNKNIVHDQDFNNFIEESIMQNNFSTTETEIDVLAPADFDSSMLLKEKSSLIEKNIQSSKHKKKKENKDITKKLSLSDKIKGGMLESLKEKQKYSVEFIKNQVKVESNINGSGVNEENSNQNVRKVSILRFKKNEKICQSDLKNTLTTQMKIPVKSSENVVNDQWKCLTSAEDLQNITSIDNISNTMRHCTIKKSDFHQDNKKLIFDNDNFNVFNKEMATHLLQLDSKNMVTISFKSHTDNNADKLEMLCSNCNQIQNIVQQLTHSIQPSKIKCPLCKKFFISLDYIKQHMQTNHLKCKKKTKCEIVITNDDSSKLQKTKLKLYPCNLCDKLFASTGFLNEHMQISHNQLNEKDVIKEEANLSENQTDNSMYCFICNLNFTNIEKYVDHVEELHVNKASVKTSTSVKNLLKDVQNMEFDSNKPHDLFISKFCSICNMQLQTKDDLVLHHYDSHRSNYPFLCPSCFLGFSTREDMANHIVTHKKSNKKFITFTKFIKIVKQSEEANSKQVYLQPVKKIEVPTPFLKIEDKLNIAPTDKNVNEKITDFIKKGQENTISLNKVADTIKIDELMRSESEAMKKKNNDNSYCNDKDTVSLKRKNSSIYNDNLAKKTKVEEKKYICKICSKEFDSQRTYSEHIFFLHDATLEDSVVIDLLTPAIEREMEIEERDLDESNESLKSLTEDKRTNFCIECSHDFLTKDDFVMHRFTIHNDQSLVHICENCNKILTSVPSVNLHTCVGIKSFNCEHCKMIFTSAVKLNKHNILYHFENDGSHNCKYCKKDFLTNRMLKKHNRISHPKNNDVSFSKILQSSNRETVDNVNFPNNGTLMSVHIIPIENKTANRKAPESIQLNTFIDYEAYNKVTDIYLEYYRINMCMPINSRTSLYEKKCFLCDQLISSGKNLVAHWIQKHSSVGDICNLCGGPYQKIKEAIHMLDHHVKSPIQRSVMNPEATLVEEVDEFIKLFGRMRLLAIFLYHMIGKRFNNTNRGRCIICPQEFADVKTCRTHFLYNHDKICVLCNIFFDSSKSAAEHKEEAHNSVDSYLWFVERSLLYIMDALNIDAESFGEEALCRTLVRSYELSRTNMSFEECDENLKKALSLKEISHSLIRIVEYEDLDDDNEDNKKVLVVIDDDFVKYKNNFRELATHIKPNTDFLTIEEIIILLENYVKSRIQ